MARPALLGRITGYHEPGRSGHRFENSRPRPQISNPFSQMCSQPPLLWQNGWQSSQVYVVGWGEGNMQVQPREIFLAAHDLVAAGQSVACPGAGHSEMIDAGLAKLTFLLIGRSWLTARGGGAAAPPPTCRETHPTLARPPAPATQRAPRRRSASQARALSGLEGPQPSAGHGVCVLGTWGAQGGLREERSAGGRGTWHSGDCLLSRDSVCPG